MSRADAMLGPGRDRAGFEARVASRVDGMCIDAGGPGIDGGGPDVPPTGMSPSEYVARLRAADPRA